MSEQNHRYMFEVDDGYKTEYADSYHGAQWISRSGKSCVVLSEEQPHTYRVGKMMVRAWFDDGKILFVFTDWLKEEVYASS